MSAKEELKQLILEITRGIIDDSLTFTKIRLQYKPLYKSLQTGGGNFLMALGLLSVIGFIAKVYMVLSKPDSIIDDTKHNELKNFKLELAKLPQTNKKLLGKLIVPRVGYLNEEDAFVNLVKKIQSENIVYLGLDDDSSKKIWRIYRNKLAHLTVPLSPAGVYDEDLSHLSWEAIEHEISKQGSFLVRDELILCNSDKLVQESKTIGIWLCFYIDTCNEETVTSALNWLKLELS